MDIKNEIKTHIINYLSLEEIQPEDIADDAPLFGEGLGLDSIDALELIVMLDKEYKINISDPEAGKKVFQSVRSLADYVVQNRPDS